VLGNLGSGLDSHVERRVRWLFAAVVLVFGLFGLRLFQLQVIEGEALRIRSERNRIRTVRLEAPRGDILDRAGRPIATTRASFALQAIPAEVQRSDLTWEVLGRLVGVRSDELVQRLGAPQGRRRFQPVELIGDLSRDQLARVESHRYALSGVTTDIRPRRTYVGGSLAAHLLGTIGEVREEQLDTRAFADYRAGEIVGQSGVEGLLESHLRGRAGGRNVVVDVAGREVEVLEEVDPRPGGDAVLTLDLDLQRVAHAAFAPEGPGGRPLAGAVVVLDPRGGDVLALVSSPAYDPNDFVGGIDAGTWRALAEDPRRPLHDRALSGQYPPGSTYKAIVAAAALEEGLVAPEEPVYCPGNWRLGRRVYRCWKRPGHGRVDLHRALVESCDVYFYEVGRRLGIDRIAFFARGFGLGRRTGLELPQEKPGLVPTTAWKLARRGEPWIEGETVSAAIGQGFNLVTPLQLAVATGAVATGWIVEPRLLLARTDHDGRVVEETAPATRGSVPVSAEHLARVRRALVGVVEERHGTGRAAAVPGLAVAGKTGTSQVVGLVHTEDAEEEDVPERHRDHAWFTAWAPADDPRIVVTVLIEHGGHGGSAAAPVAGRILRTWWERQQPPEEPLVTAHAPDGRDGEGGRAAH